MHTDVMPRQICLAHKSFVTTRVWAEIFLLAVLVVREHVLVVIVPPGKALVGANLAVKGRVGGIRVSTIASSSTADTIARARASRALATNAFFRGLSLI